MAPYTHCRTTFGQGAIPLGRGRPRQDLLGGQLVRVPALRGQAAHATFAASCRPSTATSRVERPSSAPWMSWLSAWPGRRGSCALSDTARQPLEGTVRAWRHAGRDFQRGPRAARLERPAAPALPARAALDLILRHTEVIELAGGVDYRLRALEMAQILYHCPLVGTAEQGLQSAFEHLVADPVWPGALWRSRSGTSRRCNRAMESGSSLPGSFVLAQAKRDGPTVSRR